MSELTQVFELLKELNSKVDSMLTGSARPAPEKAGDVSLAELTRLLSVAGWTPSLRTVKAWTRRHRASLVKVTTRPVSYSRASVEAVLNKLRAPKAPAVAHGRPRL